MLTAAEKNCLALTLSFLLAGAGIKAWQRYQVRLGPFQDPPPAGRPAVVLPEPPTAPMESLAEADLPARREEGPAPESGEEDAQGGRPASVAADPDQAPAGGGPDALLTPPADATPIRGAPPPSRRKKGEGSSRESGRKSPPASKVSLNRASAAELAEIPGIGAKTALAILEYRKTRGEFLDLKELLHVKGIGEKKLGKIAPYLVIAPVIGEEPLRQARLPSEKGQGGE